MATLSGVQRVVGVVRGCLPIIPSNGTDQRRIVIDVRDGISDLLGVASDRVSQVVFLFIDENNMRNEVSSVCYQSSQDRESENNTVLCSMLLKLTYKLAMSLMSVAWKT